MIKTDGSYPFDKPGWKYVRDEHGNLPNLDRTSAAALFGLDYEQLRADCKLDGAGHFMINKCYKMLPASTAMAIYNYDGHYRLIYRKPRKDQKGGRGRKMTHKQLIRQQVEARNPDRVQEEIHQALEAGEITPFRALWCMYWCGRAAEYMEDAWGEILYYLDDPHLED